VYSVELRPALAAFGRDNIARHGLDNVTLEVGDGARGYPKWGPYDVVVLTGSVPVLPRAFRECLAPGGRTFAVVGDAPVMHATLVRCTAPGAFSAVELFETQLAPLANCEQPSRFRF
jgi:protein-L-isoaspartate(D-aspartate) O-methyltransferase